MEHWPNQSQVLILERPVAANIELLRAIESSIKVSSRGLVHSSVIKFSSASRSLLEILLPNLYKSLKILFPVEQQSYYFIK